MEVGRVETLEAELPPGEATEATQMRRAVRGQLGGVSE